MRNEDDWAVVLRSFLINFENKEKDGERPPHPVFFLERVHVINLSNVRTMNLGSRGQKDRRCSRHTQMSEYEHDIKPVPLVTAL
jgi:hypothetical protein